MSSRVTGMTSMVTVPVVGHCLVIDIVWVPEVPVMGGGRVVVVLVVFVRRVGLLVIHRPDVPIVRIGARTGQAGPGRLAHGVFGVMRVIVPCSFHGLVPLDSKCVRSWRTPAVLSRHV
jgi:hypothetical protein